MGAVKREVSQNTLDLFYIISCAMHDVAPDEDIISSLDMDSLYGLSVGQNVGAIVFMGLQKSEGFKARNAELYEKWEKYQKQSLKQNLLVDIERERLFAFLEENKIWYMPLKGCVLQSIYPAYGMRQMSDNDILFDENYREKVHDYMVENGYNVESYKEDNHDVYLKPPVYNFEMHVGLMGERYGSMWCDYYSNVKDRLILKGDSPYEYRFTDEDFYIFQFVHANKHYRLGSMGLKFLIDTYACVLANDNMDRDYLNRNLDMLGIADFARTAENLSCKLMAEPVRHSAESVGDDFAEDEISMLYIMQLAMMHGSRESKVEAEVERISRENKGKKHRKLDYYMKRAFPDDEWWRRTAPFCFEHVWARPFYNIYRFVRGVTVRRKKLSHEIDIVNDKIK